MEKSQANVVTQDKVGATTKVTTFEVAGVKFAAVRTLVPMPHWRVRTEENGVIFEAGTAGISTASVPKMIADIEELLTRFSKGDVANFRKQMGLPERIEREAQYEVHINGTQLVRGDEGSIGVIFGNLDGRNFAGDRVGHEQTHSQWLDFMAQEYATQLEPGMSISMLNPDGATVEKSSIGNGIQQNASWEAVLKKEPTPRQIEATMKPGCPKPGEVERLYAARDTFVAALKERGNIEPSDLSNLDRLGRFKVADECWDISSIDTRQALLDDPHHQVRSAAVISQQIIDVSDSYEKSFALAVDLACQQKDDAYPAPLGEPRKVNGKVLEVTEHHVVQSLGRTAVIHEKRNLDRVPEKGEMLNITYDGKGPAKVDVKVVDKGVSR